MKCDLLESYLKIQKPFSETPTSLVDADLPENLENWAKLGQFATLLGLRIPCRLLAYPRFRPCLRVQPENSALLSAVLLLF